MQSTNAASDKSPDRKIEAQHDVVMFVYPTRCWGWILVIGLLSLASQHTQQGFANDKSQLGEGFSLE